MLDSFGYADSRGNTRTGQKIDDQWGVFLNGEYMAVTPVRLFAIRWVAKIEGYDIKDQRIYYYEKCESKFNPKEFQELIINSLDNFRINMESLKFKYMSTSEWMDTFKQWLKD